MDDLIERVLSVVDEQGIGVDALCVMLEISEEELLTRFVDKLEDNKEKFGIYEDPFDEKETGNQEQWEGFQIRTLEECQQEEDTYKRGS